MEELAEIAEEIDVIASIVDFVSVWIDEDVDLDRAVERLKYVVKDCEEIADEIRKMAGKGD